MIKITKNQNLDIHAEPLRTILKDAQFDMLALYDTLISGEIGVEAWEDMMRRLIARYHLRAFRAGRGSKLTASDVDILARLVGSQYDYLAGFRRKIADTLAAGKNIAGMKTRAELYAVAPKTQYWRGVARGNGYPPAPAYPGEDSQCMVNCRCNLEWHKLDGEGNYDMFWRLGATKHDRHCQTCVARAKRWNPLRWRDGVLLVPNTRFLSPQIAEEMTL